MDIYQDHYARAMRYDDAYERARKKQEEEDASQYAEQKKIKKQDQGERLLSEEQALQLKDKYNPANLTQEEEKSLIQELNNMGILTKEDCRTYSINGGNILNSLARQIREEIYSLYKMAIAGKDGALHIERIKSRQKLLRVAEQLTAE